jgi:flagellar basal-body rod protein FlgF
LDKYLYVAMTGARESLRAQGINSHNLANASTTGFRAELAAFASQAVGGGDRIGNDSRVFASIAETGWSRASGPLQSTGRDLDIAVEGEGFIAVQAPDGAEAYTRAGDLRLDATGAVRNGAGHPVLGDGGPLVIPPHASLVIGSDGALSIVPLGQGAETMARVGRIKLVKPDAAQMTRGADGLFRLKDGGGAAADASVRVVSGALEGSNVNVADTMVRMIELSRQFEMHMKSLRTAEENARNSSSLLRLG